MRKKSLTEEQIKIKIDAVKKMIEIAGGTREDLAKIVFAEIHTIGFWLKKGAPIRRHDFLVSLFKEKIHPHEIFPELYQK